ncbi:hypothetical protein GBA52_015451 [Prunus armeniaca]|nr:hypothetical protein GBA52_015451 [Prunus armeniaca]
MLCFGNRARREEAAQLAPLVYESSEGRGAQPSLAKRTKLSAQTSPLILSLRPNDCSASPVEFSSLLQYPWSRGREIIGR